VIGHLPFVSVYLNEILIFSRKAEEAVDRIRQVVQIEQDNKLHAKIAKCHFFLTFLDFLGHVVTVEGIKPCPKHIPGIKNWYVPKHSHLPATFLGFVNYYGHFIPLFAKTAEPQNALENKNPSLI